MDGWNRNTRHCGNYSLLKCYNINIRAIEVTVRAQIDVMLQCVAVVQAHKGDVNYCCFSPNGKLIASASGDNTCTVRLFDSRNGCELPQSPLKGHQYYVNVCVFSPDGRILASGSTDGKVKLWSTETCKEVGE